MTYACEIVDRVSEYDHTSFSEAVRLNNNHSQQTARVATPDLEAIASAICSARASVLSTGVTSDTKPACVFIHISQRPSLRSSNRYCSVPQ